MRDKWETSVKSFGPKHPEWETSVRDKWETSVHSCGPRQPEWETSVGVKWETSGRQVQAHAAQGTQSGRQVWETSVGDKWETSVNSCGPRHPECETSVGDKCKLMRPKTPRVGDKCGRQV